jgi:hypothetical protein
MKLAVRKSRGDAVAAVTLFLKSRTRYGAAVLNQPRRFFRWRLRAPQTALSCHAAFSHGSGRSRRGHWQLQIALRSLQSLDRRLFVHA